VLVEAEPIDRWAWRATHDEKARRFAKRHFGGPNGLSTIFPCMRDTYPWADDRPPVADARVPAKNNTEYKGLERHASQYHATAQYDFAYHHWLLAAWWRRVDIVTHGFADNGHLQAVRFCLQHAAYNEALWRWQKRGGRGAPPAPEAFDLDAAKVDALEDRAQKQLDAVTPAPQ
jgi:hypothetical protein